MGKKNRWLELQNCWARFKYYHLGGKEKIAQWEKKNNDAWSRFFYNRTITGGGSNSKFKQWWIEHRPLANLQMALHEIKFYMDRAREAIKSLKLQQKKGEEIIRPEDNKTNGKRPQRPKRSK
jgi:hypothetical protein